MAKRVTKEEFLRDLRAFSENLIRRSEMIPFEIVTQIRRFIVQTGTIDTGKLLFAFDYSGGTSINGARYIISTSSDPDRFGIEGFTEFSHRQFYWGHDSGKDFKGRQYIRQGIEAADLESIFNETAAATFG